MTMQLRLTPTYSTLHFTATIVISFLMFGCARESEIDYPSTFQRELRLSAQQRESLLSNELFIAIYNENLRRVEQLVATDPELLRAVNEEHKETPFGMALRLEYRALTMPLLNAMAAISKADLNHRNVREESYAFLAARAGDLPVIRELGRLVRESTPSYQSYTFSDIDKPDEKGRYASFVSRNAEVMSALEHEYLGRTNRIHRTFYSLSDKLGRNFLHWAAIENRADVINWTTKSFCGVGRKSESGWFASAGDFYDSATKTIAYNIGDIGGHFDLLINRKDGNGEIKPLMNRNGLDVGTVANRTALHLASQALSLSAIDALLNCPWIDTNSTDINDNTPAHLFLMALDHRTPQHPTQVREVFRRLVTFTTCQFTRCRGGQKLAATTNDDIQTPAHIAAQLADPYFYNVLQNIFNVMSTDSNGQTPHQIRVSQKLRQSTPSQL